MQIRETIKDVTAILTLEGNSLCLPDNGMLKGRVHQLVDNLLVLTQFVKIFNKYDSVDQALGKSTEK